MVRKVVLACIAILSFVITTGCWDIKEIQDMIYLNAVGLDYVDGQYVVYGQSADFASVAKQENGKPTEEAQVWIGKGKGSTLNEALFDLYSTAQLRLFWGHITAIVLSESFIQDGLQAVFDLIGRYSEVRANIWIYSTNDPVEHILSTTSFFGYSSLHSLLHEPMDPYHQNSLIEPLYLFRFISDYTERGKTTLLPSLTVNNEQWKVSDKNHPMLSIDGIYIFQRGVFKGRLNIEDLKGLAWMNENTTRSQLTLRKKDRVFAELIIQDPKINIKATIVSGKPKFEIDVKLEARVNELLEKISENEIIELVEEKIQKDIIDTYNKGLALGVDVYQLGYRLYKKNAQVWYDLFGRDEHRFPLNQESIADLRIKIKLISSGKLKLRGGFDPHKR